MAKRTNTSPTPINGTSAIACRLPAEANALAEIGLDASTWRVLVDSIFPSAKTQDGVMLAVRYCQARGLDIMKRPVHVVPMWSKTLGREVETVWPGIAEVQTTAARTGLWAGMDSPKFGPDKTRTFRGTVWRDGRQENGQADVTYPEWVEFTVYRLVAGVRCAFTEVVFWEETYARSGKSELPNEMWQKRPRGQLLKCGKAAALRAAFPEEAGEYVAEEMEGKSIDADGVPVHAMSMPTAAIATVSEQPKDPVPVEVGVSADAPAAELDDQIKAHVAALVKRAAATGAWAAADEYARSRFSGDYLEYALEELERAADGAQAKAA